MASRYHKVHEGIFRVIEQDRFYGDVLMQCEIRISDEVPTAAVTMDGSGYILFVNPDLVDAASIDGLAGVLIHEAQHVAHGHLLQTYNRSDVVHHYANIAMDLAINQINPLIDEAERSLGFRGMRVEDFGFDRDLSWGEYYHLVKPKCSCNKSASDSAKDDGQAQDSQGQGGQGQDVECPVHGKGRILDDHSIWDQIKEKVDPELAREITRDVLRNASMRAGKAPKAVEDLLRELSKKPQIKWSVLLENWLLETVDYSFDWKPLKESPFVEDLFPHLGFEENVYELAVYLDASGSIDNDELVMFLGEVKGILDQIPSIVHLYQFDTEISSLGELEDPSEVKFVRLRSGGTSFEACFKHAIENDHRNIILFTDGYDNVPDRKLLNAVQHFWVCTPNGNFDHLPSPKVRFNRGS